MNFKTTLIILAVFIILGGAYFFFGRPSPDTEQSKTDQQKIREVYTLSQDKIRQISLSFKDEAYQPLTLAKNADGIWQLTTPFTADADPPKINEMLQDLLEKRVKQTLEAEDLAQYGLQPPNIRIELWTEGETPAKTFLIGDRTVNYSVYTKEQSESHIFLIESSALDDFTKSPSDLRDRDVFNFSPAEVTTLRLQVGDQPEIRCKRQADSNPDVTGDAEGWEMIHPVKAKADARVVEDIVSALSSLRVVVFEADGEYDPADYGLNQPKITIALQTVTDDKIQELQIGSDAGTPGRIFVTRSDHRAVYTVNREIYTKLNRTVFDFRDKRVIDFQRTATHQFVIRQGESKIECQKGVDGEWEITAPVVLKADEEAVDDLLFGVDALRAVAFIDDQSKSLRPYGLDSPSIEVSFMAPDTELAVLLVGKMTGDNIYVKAQNAEPVFLVKKTLLDLVGLGIAGLRSKQILDFDGDDAARIALKHGDVNLICQKQGANWRLTHPVQEQAKNRAIRNIIEQVNRLTVEAFLPVSPSITTAGFDMPEIRLAVTLKDRTEHLLEIGKLVDDKHYYGRLQNAPDTVFLLQKETVENLKQTVDDLRATPDAN
ncbi:hypothetical protein C6502_15870 [Candidatus Poribacteria bacterium]|nr:MAG: hypothetical protein C6502_15870 [Candidatus Poribacteria bacterium]